MMKSYGRSLDLVPGDATHIVTRPNRTFLSANRSIRPTGSRENGEVLVELACNAAHD